MLSLESLQCESGELDIRTGVELREVILRFRTTTDFYPTYLRDTAINMYQKQFEQDLIQLHNITRSCALNHKGGLVVTYELLKDNPLQNFQRFLFLLVDKYVDIEVDIEVLTKTIGDYLKVTHPTLAIFHHLPKVRKPTRHCAADTILQASSSHPKHLIHNIPTGQFLRLRHLCSEFHDFLRESCNLRDMLLSRGYCLCFLITVFKRAIKTSRHSLLDNNSSSDPHRSRQMTSGVRTTFTYS
ncbi:hypothetical protein XELAEV_18010680mg [Xenopus laevis]|uniref:Helix-turn-helix domain-containing protein n=1 Tax=Xenopus laevis TaxID=8355 RepID=A0A974I204_XENLA|nr:hypothetical protein XELAEV_18010680mg [Xenopus laevis]